MARDWNHNLRSQSGAYDLSATFTHISKMSISLGNMISNFEWGWRLIELKIQDFYGGWVEDEVWGAGYRLLFHKDFKVLGAVEVVTSFLVELDWNAIGFEEELGFVFTFGVILRKELKWKILIG